MTMRAVKAGELFATFIFDGKDCADMGIYSVTNGSVYTLNIEPTFSDNKLEVPAYDGKYYYGTQITGQQFQFTCFCHDLVSREYDNLRDWLHPRKVGRLILSDQPYKYYICKVVSISSLGEYPLTTIQTPQHTYLGDYAKGDVVYTGNFTVTFETVGSAYGYGLSYYRDDLIYDARSIYGVDYYYNTGLLYKDMSPRLKWTIDANANGQLIPMYNPGSSATSPKYRIEHTGSFSDNSYIQFTNATTGTSTVIDISGIPGNIIVDTVAQVLQDDNGIQYYGRFNGSAMSISPYGEVIELPETFVKNMENTDLIEYDTLYIEDNVVSINPLVYQVDEKLIGRYFCCNSNGGSKIQAINIEKNTLTLDSNVYTADIPAPVIENGVIKRPAGFEFRFIDLKDASSLPTSGQEGDVCQISGQFYLWVITSPQGHGEWQKTNYFTNEEDFKDAKDNWITIYRMFGATIVDLDVLSITTGTNINYRNDFGQTKTGSSVPSFKLEAEMQPRYL